MGKITASSKKEIRGRLARRTSATTLFAKDAREIKNICEVERVTEAALLRSIVKDWLNIQKRDSFAKNQMTAPLREVYREVVSEQIQEQVKPLRENVRLLLSLVRSLTTALEAAQPSQEEQQSDVRNLGGEAEEKFRQAITDTLNRQSRDLHSTLLRQKVTEDMIAKLFSLEWATQRFITDYLVEERLNQKGEPPENFQRLITSFREGFANNGYQALADTEDEWEVPESLRLTRRNQ